MGDALGAPVEFMSLAEIRAKYGREGICDFDEAYGRIGAITDDTQMTLFAAEGLLRAMQRGIGGAEVRIVKDSYLRWLKTQGCPLPKAFVDRKSKPGWLLSHRELFAQRAPGNTCIQALLHTPYEQLRAENASKGCGTVMRTAPVALAFAASSGLRGATQAYRMARDLAAITHGHATAQDASGLLTLLLLALLEGYDLDRAAHVAIQALRSDVGECETTTALNEARRLAAERTAPHEAIPRIGEGWVAEEAVAIAVYCALMAADFESGVRIAVNITGDSDSTGSIAGNLLGARWGEEAIPRRWLQALELRDVIGEVAQDFLNLVEDPGVEGSKREEYWDNRYPGG